MGLSNLASVSGQSVAGMIATGSHGTGASFGAFSSFVLGITFLSADGKHNLTYYFCSNKKDSFEFE